MWSSSQQTWPLKNWPGRPRSSPQISPRWLPAGPGPAGCRDGSLCVDGWCATGVPVTGTARRSVAGPRSSPSASASTPLCAAFRGHLFLDRRTSRWAISDRVAWGEIPAGDFPHVRYLARAGLRAASRVTAPSQLVHGDLSGNVLFHSPAAARDHRLLPLLAASRLRIGHRRSRMLWSGKVRTRRVLDAVSHIGDFGQYLVRALIFRAVTDWIASQEEPATSAAEDDDSWAPQPSRSPASSRTVQIPRVSSHGWQNRRRGLGTVTCSTVYRVRLRNGLIEAGRSWSPTPARSQVQGAAFIQLDHEMARMQRSVGNTSL